jgi:hypothetical protein
MFGPSKKSSAFSDQPERVLAFVVRVRQQPEAFKRRVEEELRTTRATIEELQVRRAKRRGHGHGR